MSHGAGRRRIDSRRYSVWIDHLRLGNQQLQKQLNLGQIAVHPCVIAELALGSLKERSRTLALLDLLPRCEWHN